MNISYYLGKTWSPEYDCWSLVREFYDREKGVKLPLVMIDPENIRNVLREFAGTEIKQLFKKTTTPKTGDIVEMGYHQKPSHCGIYLDFDGDVRILHNHYTGGVAAEPKPPHDILNFYTLD